MKTIKRIFGVIMLGVAIWFLERVLPESVVLALWATLFITTVIFIGALDRIELMTTHWQRLWKGSGLVLLVYGTVLIVVTASGSGAVLKPFNKPFSVNVTRQEVLPFVSIASLEELDNQLQKAGAEARSVMLYFYADWCIACKELEKHTYSDPLVQAVLKKVTLLKADITKNNEMDKALLKHFGLFGPPYILFFDGDNQEIKSHRLVGFIKPVPFVEHVNQALSLTGSP